MGSGALQLFAWEGHGDMKTVTVLILNTAGLVAPAAWWDLFSRSHFAICKHASQVLFTGEKAGEKACMVFLCADSQRLGLKERLAELAVGFKINIEWTEGDTVTL